MPRLIQCSCKKNPGDREYLHSGGTQRLDVLVMLIAGARQRKCALKQGGIRMQHSVEQFFRWRVQESNPGLLPFRDDRGTGGGCGKNQCGKEAEKWCHAYSSINGVNELYRYSDRSIYRGGSCWIPGSWTCR